MSYGALLAFVFLVFWRPQEWLFPQLFGIPFLQGVTYFAVLAMMLEYNTKAVDLKWSRAPFKIFVGLFIAAILSHAANFYYQGIIDNWMTAFRISFFSILFFATLNTPKRLLWVVRVFVFMSCFMAIHGILQIERGVGFGGQLPIASWRPDVVGLVPRSRFFGIFEDPNDMGQMLTTAMPLSFVIFKKRNFLTIIIGAALCYLLWMGIDTTWSRGSQSAAVVALAVMAIQIFPDRWFPYLFGLVIMGGMASLPFTGQLLGGAEFERVNFWGEANWAFKAHPIFGVGLGMIREYISNGRPIHNAPVTAYSELGIVGYFFWFVGILTGMVGLVQTKIHLSKDKSPNARYLYRLASWGMAAFMGFLVSSFFLSRAFIFPLFFLIAMFNAVPYIAKNYSEDADDLYIPSWRDCVIMGVPLSMASIVYIYFTIIILNMLR